MTANVTAATVSMKCWAADDGVGWQIETRSVIVATGEGPLDASFRSVLERSTVSAVIHDVEAKVHKLQLVRKRHSAVQQIQVMESKCLDFIPAEFVDVNLDKISTSSPNPLNQRMRVERKGVQCSTASSLIQLTTTKPWNIVLPSSSTRTLWFKRFGELELILSSLTSTNSAGMKSRHLLSITWIC